MEAKELSALRHLPAAVSDVLELEPQIRTWAERFAMKPVGFPIYAASCC